MSTERSVTEQEIVVPARLPTILKEFCKAAIRTQPLDLLKWSSSYFRALADGEDPPAKLRLEYPPPSTPSGLTLGFLRILLRQFGDYNKLLPVETILHRWDCLCLDRKDLNLIMMIGKFRRKCQVKKFLAIAVGLLGSSLFETMIMICELFTDEPEGGSAMIPVTLFLEIYGYLAGLKCDGSERSSSEENPADILILDDSASELQEPTGNKSLGDRAFSLASQDTEADVNLDLELVSKGEVDSARTNITNQSAEASEHKELPLDKAVDDTVSDSTLKAENSEPTSGEKSQTNDVEHVSNKIENVSEDCLSTESGSKTAGKSVVSSSSQDGRKKKKMDVNLIKYYPNIPGIGPRLGAEEVASVAIWMNECARMQGAMVGPRNLRHMNCPPLDRLPNSET